MKRFFVFFILTLCCLLPCANLSDHAVRPMVASVEIYTRHDETASSYTCWEDQTVRQILNYLRGARTHRVTTSLPPYEGQDLYLIRVRMTDGSNQIYQQIGNDFLRKNGSAWMCINPRHGKKLKILEKQVLSSHF